MLFAFHNAEAITFPLPSLVLEKSSASTALTVVWFLLRSGAPSTHLELQNISKNHLNWFQNC